MRMKRFTAVFAVMASLVLLAACAPSQAPQPAAPCDRECLVNLMKRYLSALAAHDPKSVPFAGNVKFVENTAQIPVGEGLWITASGGPGTFQIYAADPVTQQVACIVTMKETNKDVLLGARLKLADGRITEAEHLVIRDDLSRQTANLQSPRPALVADLEPSERTPREEMLKAGAAYYVALTGEDGKLAPFADDCERRENGMTTAGTREELTPIPIEASDPETKRMLEIMAKMPRSCEGQISTGAFTYITDIKDRRVVIADEQKGLVVGFSMFWHRGDVKTVKVKGIPGVDAMPSYQGTFNLPAMHIYKIKNGRIYDIEALGFVLPYGVRSGWE